eukprot:TRINITY_DN20793_c0_g1_i1.p1 TRINITY_DN20793_c0_g1~~TRINITY_DN20793_c0_g1_i1.p1  ORF type:complete len:250 (+),score=64.01 TRINITY_DN20793_c0_g1_i1:44-793(+)
MMWALFAAAAVLAAAWCAARARGGAVRAGLPHAPPGGAVLVVVIAHPDDEAMFMTPCMIGFREAGYRVKVLCLSNGGADGLGKVREKEMYSSAAGFGVARSDVTVVDDPLLEDGLRTAWDVPYAAALIARHCSSEAEGAHTAVLTFDDHGVSGHPNHIATSRAVRAALRSPNSPISAAYLVVSHAVWYKFTGVLGSLAPSCTGVGVKVGSPWPCLSAMLQHWSQMVWYRWLFIAFSRYTFAVDLEEVRR